MTNYPLADMLTRIRNAMQARHKSVVIPASKLKQKIAELLKQEGYVRNCKLIKDNKQNLLEIELKYIKDRFAVIQHLEVVSKPGRRVYVKSNEITPVRTGTGTGIYTTPKGVLTDKEAIKAKLGGEYLCKVW